MIIRNNKSCKILRIGSVRLKLHDGMERVLKEVRYIPELKRNLISLGMMDRSGCTFKSESGTLKISRGALVVMKGVIKNGLYTLIGKTVSGESSPVQHRMGDKVL